MDLARPGSSDMVSQRLVDISQALQPPHAITSEQGVQVPELDDVVPIARMVLAISTAGGWRHKHHWCVVVTRSRCVQAVSSQVPAPVRGGGGGGGRINDVLWCVGLVREKTNI
eukprot:COSAG01_NODE_12332_length_1757_cov_8.689385_1_plen_112_part_10